MSYTVWVKVENDDGMPGDTDEAWWSMDHFDKRSEACEAAEMICGLFTSATGIEASRLDDDYGNEDIEDD